MGAPHELVIRATSVLLSGAFGPAELGTEHDHAWIRSDEEGRTAAVTVDATGEHLVGGLKDLGRPEDTGVRARALAYRRAHDLGADARPRAVDLWHLGRARLEAFPMIAAIRRSAPNRHHVLADLAPFGLENPGDAYFAAVRPCGLIQPTITRVDAPPAGDAGLASVEFA